MKYNNYNEMPIAVYQQLQSIMNDTYTDENDRNIDIIAVMTGKSAPELMKLSIVEFRALADKLDWLYDKVEPSKPKKRYQVGSYYCRVEARPDTVSWAQYIDFKNLMADLDGNIAELAALLLIPKGRVYGEGYDMHDFHEAVRNTLPIADALGLLAFFFSRLQQSKINILYSSIALMKMAKKGAAMEAKIKEARGLIRSFAEEGLNLLQRMSLPSPIRPKIP